MTKAVGEGVRGGPVRHPARRVRRTVNDAVVELGGELPMVARVDGTGAREERRRQGRDQQFHRFLVFTEKPQTRTVQKNPNLVEGRNQVLFCSDPYP